MGKYLPLEAPLTPVAGTGELPASLVIAWLRSPVGSAWSAARHPTPGSAATFGAPLSGPSMPWSRGVFAEVKEDIAIGRHWDIGATAQVVIFDGEAPKITGAHP